MGNAWMVGSGIGPAESMRLVGLVAAVGVGVAGGDRVGVAEGVLVGGGVADGVNVAGALAVVGQGEAVIAGVGVQVGAAAASIGVAWSLRSPQDEPAHANPTRARAMTRPANKNV
jgi:hypothetical protein